MIDGAASQASRKLSPPPGIISRAPQIGRRARRYGLDWVGAEGGLEPHGGDVTLLTNFFIDRFNREFRKRVRGLSAPAVEMLQAYAWPGNVRELRNAIERAMLLIEAEWLEPDHFTTLTRTVAPLQFQLPPEGVNLEDVERQLLTQALERAGGNQTQTAQLLGINRDQVRSRIEKFRLAKTEA